VVGVCDLPDLTNWRKINVRDPKIRGAVPEAIKKTLLEDPTMFLFKNRGLVVTAKSVKFDNELNRLTLYLENSEIHGLLDGGHTYKVIQNYCADIEVSESPTQDQAFVRLEILEGFNGAQIIDIVDARNKSNQVKNQSLFELQQKFEGIKNAISGQPYSDKIAYKEYEIMEGEDDGKAKPIDVREIIALLTLFDKEHFGDNNHPIVAYSQKESCLTRFKQYPSSYEKIYPLLKDIVRLWDIVYMEMSVWYQSSKAKQGQGSKFGRITGVIPDKEVELQYIGETVKYHIPSSFIYPILASLRSCIEEMDGTYKWGIDVETALNNELGEQLTEVVISNAIELRNPNKLGKTSPVWDQCYSKTQVWYLKAQASKSK
jgi:hypothetical protein